MSRRRAILIPWTLVCVLALPQPGQPAHAAKDESTSTEPAERDAAQNDELRERLTEREDKRRPVEPLSIDLAGRPLTVGGEYEIGLNYLRRRVVGAAVRQPDRLLLEQGLEVEAFYSFGPPLSVFAQLRAVMEEDLLSHTFEEVSDRFVERGEMWVYTKNAAGSHVLST
jgi:hypothetical protein